MDGLLKSSRGQWAEQWAGDAEQRMTSWPANGNNEFVTAVQNFMQKSVDTASVRLQTTSEIKTRTWTLRNQDEMSRMIMLMRSPKVGLEPTLGLGNAWRGRAG